MATNAPPVDTFEHDIANEIRHKEASITDIAAAVGDIGNTNKEERSSGGSGLLIGVVLALVLCAIIGLVAMGYLYYSGKYNPFLAKVETSEPKKSVSTYGAMLNSVYPTINQAIGIHITGIEKAPSGYIVTISSYSPVFSYMVKNEQVFKDELGMSVNSQGGTKPKADPVPSATTTVATQPVTTQGSTTTISTSTQQVIGSTTPVVVEEEQVVVNPDDFYDVTIDNQNMRIGNSLFGPVAYAFVGTHHVVFSSTPLGIISLRNSILRK